MLSEQLTMPQRATISELGLMDLTTVEAIERAVTMILLESDAEVVRMMIQAAYVQAVRGEQIIVDGMLDYPMAVTLLIALLSAAPNKLTMCCLIQEAVGGFWEHTSLLHSVSQGTN